LPAVVAESRSSILNLANQLTLLRIVFVPVFIILLTYGEAGYALAVFCAAGITDFLDGVIARRFGQKTSIGAVLDPLADKFLMTASTIILSLPQMEFANVIPRWLMILMISRDVFLVLVALLIVLMLGWRVFKPSPLGKASTVIQVLMILAVLYCNWRNVTLPQLSILFYMAGIATALSGLHYLVTGRKHLGVE
jgi:cardiolipin synthase (CMP-forming)